MTDTDATPENQTPSQSGLVDLSDLRLMPAWVAGIGSGQTAKKFQDEEARPQRPGDRRGGPGRRDDRGGFRGRDGGGSGGGPRRDRDDRGPRRFDDRTRDREHARPQREWLEVPRDIHVTIEPEDKAVEALANHIRSSGHAFSMFDAARLVLAGGERFHARFACAPERPTGLFVLPAHGGAFVSREEALQHILHSSAIESYYRVEEVELEEPKGEFKSIGVCGFSGELLGPPSHHSFQAAVIRMHRERFSNMPLEDYKRRVRVDSNPELVTQWKENQRKGHRWIYLKEEPAEGSEPTSFSNRADMETHFRRTHGDDAVKEVRDTVLPGNIDKAKLTSVLFMLLRNAVDTARKHLFEMSQKLGGGFERRGLKLFKRRAGKLYVSRVKPRAIDPGVIFSERVAGIVEQLKTHPGLMLHDLVEKIAPSQAAAPAPEAVQEAPALTAEAEPEAAPKAPLSDDQISVIKDIRWLANEGYVIEYSDGMVFLGVQGEPAPAKPAAEKAAARERPADAPQATPEAEPATTAEAEPDGEDSAPLPADEAPQPGAPAPIAEQIPQAETDAETPALDVAGKGDLMEALSEPDTPVPVAEDAPEPEPAAMASELETPIPVAEDAPMTPIAELMPETEEQASPEFALAGAELSPPEAEQEEFALVEKRVEP